MTNNVMQLPLFAYRNEIKIKIPLHMIYQALHVCVCVYVSECMCL